MGLGAHLRHALHNVSDRVALVVVEAVKIRFHYPSESWHRDVDMLVCPRVGERVQLDDNEYEVCRVIRYSEQDNWLPHFYVVVRGMSSPDA